MAAFGGLVVATVAAFFITQHLKVTTPLIAGTMGATPAVIDPTDAHCSSTSISFHLLHEADEIDVSVLDGQGRPVRTLASALPSGRKQSRTFTWDGRLANGRVAPNGRYHFRVRLIHQQRTIDPLINQTNDEAIFVTLGASCSGP